MAADILLVADMRDVYQDGGFAVNELVQDTFLKSWQIIGDLATLAHTEGVVAVREKNGLELALVVQEVALVETSTFLLEKGSRKSRPHPVGRRGEELTAHSSHAKLLASLSSLWPSSPLVV